MLPLPPDEVHEQTVEQKGFVVEALIRVSEPAGDERKKALPRANPPHDVRGCPSFPCQASEDGCRFRIVAGCVMSEGEGARQWARGAFSSGGSIGDAGFVDRLPSADDSCLSVWCSNPDGAMSCSVDPWINTTDDIPSFPASRAASYS